MRFCLASTQLNWGGGEALIWSLSQQLRALGHQTTWLIRNDGGIAERIATTDKTDVLYAHARRGLAPRDWIATARRLRAWAPDVIISNDTHAVHLTGTTAWLCRSRPLRLAFKHTVFPLRSKLKYRLLTDRIVCVSEAARDVVLQGGVPRSGTAVIYGGCQPYTPEDNVRTKVRAELGIEPDELYVVAVGNLLACKGHLDLVEAVSLLPSQVSAGLKIFIAGEGPERQRLERQIAAQNLGAKIRLLGYRSDADRLVAAADLVVHPSHSEGLSLVLIQAQMLGKPIVATAVGGAAEVLGVGEATAWVARPVDPSSLAEQITKAAEIVRSNPNELRHQLDQKAITTRQIFELRNSAQQLVDLAASILEKR